MKKSLLAFLIAAIAFATGSIASLYFSNRLTSGRNHQLSADSMLRFNAELRVATALYDIRHAKTRDIASLVRSNCKIIDSAIRLIKPEIYDNPEKRKEVASFKEFATQTTADLKRKGECSSSELP